MSPRLTERERVLTAFLDEQGERFSRACHDVARAFGHGGVFVHGDQGAATDAAHVPIAFMHPGGCSTSRCRASR